MTPKTLKQRVREMAHKYSKAFEPLRHPINIEEQKIVDQWRTMNMAFAAGAEAGFKLAVEMLRSDEAKQLWLSSYNSTSRSFLPTNEIYADLLERKWEEK